MLVCTLIFVSLSIFLGVSAVPLQYQPFDCVAPPLGLLAPLEACRAVISHIYEKHVVASRDGRIIWGRDVEPHTPGYMQTPCGFRLTPMWPLMQERVPCEIYVDNVLDRETARDGFSFMHLIDAAVTVLNECYPRGYTGKSYPARTRNIYVTTVYLPGLLAASRNYTVYNVDIGEKQANLTNLWNDIAPSMVTN